MTWHIDLEVNPTGVIPGLRPKYARFSMYSFPPPWTLRAEPGVGDSLQHTIWSSGYDSTRHILWAGTEEKGAAWKSIDGGENWAVDKFWNVGEYHHNWQFRDASSSSGWIDIKFVNWPQYKYVACSFSGKIMWSWDGINWTEATAPVKNYRSVAWGYGGAIAYPGIWVAVCLFGGTQAAAYSTDGGLTWNLGNTTSGYDYSSVCWESTTNSFVACALNGAANNMIARSTDGINWTPVATPVGADAIDWQSIKTDGSGNLVAVGTNGPDNQRAMTSNDGGLTWTLRTTPNTSGVNWRDVCYSPQLNMWLAVSSGNGTSAVMISTDGGATWNYDGRTVQNISWNTVTWSNPTDINLPSFFVAMASGGTGNRLMWTPNPVTDDWTALPIANQTWQCIFMNYEGVGQSGGGAPNNADLPRRPELIAVSSDGAQQVYASNQNPTQNEHHAMAYDEANDALIFGFGYATTVPGKGDTDLFASFDGGATWDHKLNVLNEFDIQTILVDPFHGTWVIATSSDATVWVSDDLGETWSFRGLNIGGYDYVYSGCYDSFRHDLYLGVNFGAWAGIMKSTDGGYTWTEAVNFMNWDKDGPPGPGSSSTEPQRIHGMAYDPVFDTIVVATGHNAYGAYFISSKDGGSTWAVRQFLDWALDYPGWAHCIEYNPDSGRLYAGCDSLFGPGPAVLWGRLQVWYSEDGGDNWVQDQTFGDLEANFYSMTYDSFHQKMIVTGGKYNSTIPGEAAKIWQRES